MAKTMGLSTEAAPTNESQPVQRTASGRPYCPKHNCLMVAYSSKSSVTHYKCPVESCDATEKRVRDGVQVPKGPQRCGSKLCDGAAMEVVPEFVGSSNLLVKCPKCGATLHVPRPMLPRQAMQNDPLTLSLTPNDPWKSPPAAEDFSDR